MDVFWQNNTFWAVANTTNATFSSTNISIEVPLTATWTIMPVFSLIMFVFGCIGNGTLLLLFVKDRSLRTPFNIYLVNLLLANMFCILVQYPMDLITNLYAFQWFMGDTACTVYLYAAEVFQGAIFNAHQLIAINRIWAVTHPISYRSHHSIRTAIFLCVGMWAYVHLAIFPGWIADTLYYRLPVETNGCLSNGEAQPTWTLVIDFLLFMWPEIVILSSLPIIHCTKKMRHRIVRRNNLVIPQMLHQGTINLSERLTEHSAKAVVNQGALNEVRSTGTSMGVERVAVVTASFGVVSRSLVVKKQKSNSKGYFLLALMAVSVVICWTPDILYYLLVTFIKIDAPIFYQVATILFSCQTIIDPILYTAALESLRKSFRRTFFSYTL